MAQIPTPGIARRETIVPDHLIEDLTVDVTDAESGTGVLTKDHRFIPACIMVDLVTAADPHVNLYLTEVTNVSPA